MKSYLMKARGDLEWIEIEAKDFSAAVDIALDAYKDEPAETDILVIDAP